MLDRTQNLNQIRDWVKKIKVGNVKATDSSTRVTHESSSKLAPIAISGVSGYFPDCMDVHSFWDKLDNDVSMISEVPSDRFNWKDYWDSTGQRTGSTKSKWGGFIPDIASFDAELFGILPMEADEMDPRQRLLLMSTWQTLLDASIDPGSLKKSNTGVFIACEGNEYAQLMGRDSYVPASQMTQTDSMIANRISYQFDFAGPSEMVNATCAGFAVALHRAVVSLRAGLIDRAIVGAANLILLPDPHVLLSQSEQLSDENTVRSFGKNGRGFIRSEGVGTILIERLEDAQAAQRKSYAVIKHTGVNFNGQGGVSMTAPNVEAHSDLVKKCFREAEIDPHRLSYIEAQGMGLPVADIAEWAALNRALSELCEETGESAKPGFCKVSSLKPMMGHMHSASSLGALLKIIRSFQTGVIHKVLDYDEPNEYCDMEGTPCRIANTTEAWESNGKPRLAAFHSYGSGGNNVHVILEEGQGAERYEITKNERFHADVFNKRHYWYKVVKNKLQKQRSRQREEVKSKICEWLALDDKASTQDTPFLDLGVNSLSLVGLVAKLQVHFEVPIRKSDAYSHSTPRKMADHVFSLISERGDTRRMAGDEQPILPIENNNGKDGIAIIGMSLQVAGADNPSEFWRLLKEGRCSISDLPESRQSAISDNIKTAKGGFIENIANFDSSLFKIAPTECESMDPRHRKLLESAWSAIEDSGYRASDWKDAMNGIFIGIDESDYPITKESAITSIHAGTAPARIGYYLDSKGPVLALSTACSSSLVAVHSACKSILSGESEVAMAGGCSLICQPERTFFALSQMGDMLSPDSTCYAFDSRANGMVLGEGVGLVILKRLSAARRDGDSVYAVIKGSGINYDGRTNGLTAPSGERQRELYQQVYKNSGVKPEQISYVVSHGTGTALGDPVECNALIDAFSASTKNKQFCALTSPKSNIGHTQAAAGVVNLITAALALKNKQIPPTLNYEKANEDIDFEQSPFYVNSTLADWDVPERFAAVSSFGHTGTNAHIVLGQAEDIVEPSERAILRAPVAVILSAASKNQLKAMVTEMLELPEQDLEDFSYTLQVGRMEMDVRLAFVADSWESFRDRMYCFLHGTESSEAFYLGEVDEITVSEAADKAIRNGQIDELVELWVSGVAIDWSKLYSEYKPNRLHLPTYSFEKEHFWLNSEVEYIEDPAQLLTFKQVWKSKELGSLSDEVNRLFVALSSQPNQRQLLDGIKRIAKETTVLALREETCEGYLTAFEDTVSETKNRDAILYLHQIEDPNELTIPAELLALVKAIAKQTNVPKRLIVSICFSGDLGRIFADAWIAFVQSVQNILPKISLSVVGIDPGSSHKKEQLIWNELNTAELENVFYLNGVRHILEVQPTELNAGTPVLKRGGTYMITGGLGGVGYIFAQHLAKKYKANLALIGRSTLDPTGKAKIELLRNVGSEVSYVQSDVSDLESLRVGIDSIKQRFGKIDGVIHSAGIEGTVSVLEKDVEDFSLVLDSKVNGTLFIDEVLKDEQLDFIAYFSSSSAVLGDLGVCDYAMASRFQMAFTSYRNELFAKGVRSGRAVVFNWPMWLDGGMVDAESDRSRFYLATSGQRALKSAEGIQIFEQVLTSDNGEQHLIFSGKPENINRFLQIEVIKPSLEQVPVIVKSVSAGRGRRPEMTGLSIQECIEYDLKNGVSELLKIAPRKLKLKTNFLDFGFDSMSLATFSEWLSDHYDIEFTPAVFFGHSTLESLTEYFVKTHGGVMDTFYAKEVTHEAVTEVKLKSAPVAKPKDTAVKDTELSSDEPIAIIGMSGRFPQARDIESMWSILEQGKDVVEEIPMERYDWRPHFGDPSEGKSLTYGKWCGLLPGVAEFDPLFFEISPREAAGMDPRQRHLLQESWNALEDAGYGPQQIGNEKIGMFVGVEEGDYVFLAEEGEITSNHSGVLASRLAYFLDLKGPVIALNTACSSGLVAAHQACQSLRNGECDSALAAGVSINATPAGLIAMGQSAMLSEDGKCHTFDKKANGLVPGEAVVTLVLKPLSKAEADGDPIHAVIVGSGVNYDGKTNGITAPSMTAQTELLQSVYKRSKTDPASLDYIVTHGTGTKLGDPVEIGALAEAFKGADCDLSSCALTSTKTNFGHSFAASGLLSAVSLVESIKRKMIPASLHCEEASSYINWSKSPFYVNTVTKPWVSRENRKRIGGVSAFGMSGTNAHMLIEEYSKNEQSTSAAQPYYLLVLSGKTEEALQQRIVDMLDLLQNDELSEEQIAAMSYTLLSGRHHFQYRLAIVVRDFNEAKLLLNRAQQGESHPTISRDRVSQEFRGQKVIRRQVEALLNECHLLTDQPEEYQEILGALGAYYCQGYEFVWSELFGDECPRRIGLPTYPFARETYWLTPKSNTKGNSSLAESTIHPLLHRNVSDFDEQRFSSTYTGAEFFLEDHRIHGEKILAGVCLLEMVRAALVESVSPEAQQGNIVLSQIVWLNPVVVRESSYEVFIGLADEGNHTEFEIYSIAENREELLHCKGRGQFSTSMEADNVDLLELRERMTLERAEAKQCYAAFEAAGIEYGESFQVLREILVGDQQVFASLTLPDVITASVRDFELHPSIMDGAFQATLGLALFAEKDSAPRIPFALENIEVFNSCPQQASVWVRRSEASKVGDKVERLDLDIFDQQGQLCVRMKGFSTRAIASDEKISSTLTLTGEEFFLKDHGGLLPGVVSLEWARVAGSQVGEHSVFGLKNVVWNKTISVKAATSVSVDVLLEPSGSDFSYQIRAAGEQHAQGKVVTSEPPLLEMSSVDLTSLRATCAEVLSKADCDVLLQTNMGPSFAAITHFRHSKDEALAQLELPKSVHQTVGDYVLHPSMLNGAVQAANILLMLEYTDDQPPLPFSLDALWIYGPVPQQACAVIRKKSVSTGGPQGSRISKFGIDIVDQNGNIAVVMHNYAAVSVADDSKDILLAVPQWKEAPLELAGKMTKESQPLFILSEGDSDLEQALLSRWENARIDCLETRRDDQGESFGGRFTQLLRIVKDLLSMHSASLPPVYLLMNGNSSPSEEAGFAGLLKTVCLEKPGFVSKLMSFDDQTEVATKQLVTWIESELSVLTNDVEVRYDSLGMRSVRRLKEIQRELNKSTAVVNQADVVWITGGLGGLGKICAEHFGNKRQARLILSGRSGLKSAGEQYLTSLRDRGIKVRYLQGDVTNLDEVKSMLTSIMDTEGKLNGILHSAGVIDDAYLIKKELNHVTKVLQPKVAGALALDQATSDIELDFFVLFSSLTSVFGNPGQADYAAANGFLDGFATERNQRRSGRTLSVNWPLWQDGGMRMDEENEQLLKQNSGMVPMTSEAGMMALENALASEHDQVLVMQGYGSIIRDRLLSQNAIEGVQAKQFQKSEVVSTDRGAVISIQRSLVGIVADLQKISLDRIELDVELSQYGFDSLGLTSLANRLNKTYGLELMPTVFFEFSTLKGLSKHLLETYPNHLIEKASTVRPDEIKGAVSEKRSGSRRLHRQNKVQSAPVRALKTQPIAIVGASGRFPGSPDLDTFWEHLEANRDLVSEVPEDRWKWQDYYGDPTEELGKTKVKSAGFIEGIDLFDAPFFGISPREAIAMDPQFRLLLETTWATIEDAGYRASDLAGSKTGVFMGASTSDYKDAWFQEIGNDPTKQGPPLVSHFVLANRISYIFDLQGPSEPIDTACSSSLVAIHRAIESIRQGNCEQALVGGVNLISSPNITLGASRAGMLSEDGRCKTFDQSADGYGRGEGLGVVFLKPLDVAEADGDTIYGLIRGSAENHGGKANSPTSPNPVAQKDLLVTAYSKAGVDPRSVSYIEAHGTGTELGDPIEINGLKSAFETLYENEGLSIEDQHCGLGSVKTNIGHLEAAAGMAGILKVMLMMRHQKIPGNPHLNEPNSYLELDDSPFYLQKDTQDWKSNGTPRCAGVSSFGIGGSNAHVILEEYQQRKPVISEENGETQIIVLTAKNVDRLKVVADRFFTALTDLSKLGNPSLEEIANTLQMGREPLETRLCFTADTFEELRSKLTQFINGDSSTKELHLKSQKRVSKRRFDDNEELQESVASWIKEGNFARLLELWGRGVELDWQAMHVGKKLRRISLPTYPFERKSYWFPRADRSVVKETVVRTPAPQQDVVVQADESRRRISLTPLGSGVLVAKKLLAVNPKLQLLPLGNDKKVPLAEPSKVAVVALHKPQTIEMKSPNTSVAKVYGGSGISRESLEQELTSGLADILFMNEEEIEFDRPFTDLGLDSVIGVEWINSINQNYGLKITASKIYDYPNLDAMIDFLMEQIGLDKGMNLEAADRGGIPLGIDEVLVLVQQKKISVDEADRLLTNFKFIQ